MNHLQRLHAATLIKQARRIPGHNPASETKAYATYTGEGGNSPFVRGLFFGPEAGNIPSSWQKRRPAPNAVAPMSSGLHNTLDYGVRADNGRLNYKDPTLHKQGPYWQPSTSELGITPHTGTPVALHEYAHSVDPDVRPGGRLLNRRNRRNSPYTFEQTTGEEELPAMIPETLAYMRGAGVSGQQTPGHIQSRNRWYNASPIPGEGTTHDYLKSVYTIRGRRDYRQKQRDHALAAQRTAHPGLPGAYHQMEKHGPLIGSPGQTPVDGGYSYVPTKTQPGQQHQIPTPPVRTPRGWTETVPTFERQLLNTREWMGALRDPETNLNRAYGQWARKNKIHSTSNTAPTSTGGGW